MMDNARFLAVLNQALRESGLDLAAPTSPTDPAAVAAWAGFLRLCVAQGVSIADSRWRSLEMRSHQGSHSLVLAPGHLEREQAADGEEDFTLGLSLLMSMLGRSLDRDD